MQKKKSLKKKILVVTGTRAEYGLLRSTMDALRADARVDMRMLVTGMHTLASFGNTQNEIRQDGYQIAARVPIRESDDMLGALSREIAGIRAYCDRSRPDCIVVLGDRDEPLAAAIVAAHLNIPLAHIHGGDVSGTTTVDNAIRGAITKFAHLHFPTTALGASRIRAFGEEPWRIHAVGAPGLDQIKHMRFPTRAETARTLGLDPARRWILAVHHPTPFDETPIMEQIRPLMTALVQDFPDDEKIVIYPNSDTGTRSFVREIERARSQSRMHIRRTMPRDLYLAAFRHAACIVGNSSSGIIESTSLRVPSVSVGTRQSNRERGANVIASGYDRTSITRSLRRALSQAFRRISDRAKSPYGRGTAGRDIARYICSGLEDPRIMRKRDPYV